jgi:hypothetical protein
MKSNSNSNYPVFSSITPGVIEESSSFGGGAIEEKTG